MAGLDASTSGTPAYRAPESSPCERTTEKPVSMWIAGGIVLLMTACSRESGSGMMVPGGSVAVTGEVLSEDDQTPVDGGVTMRLAFGAGKAEILQSGQGC